MITNSGLESVAALLEPENWVGSLANVSAQVLLEMADVNWVGFYLWDGRQLRLGPFAGKPACTLIPFGKGVCGTAAERRQTLVVDDVDQFPGHIVCDAASKSEIVVPLLCGDELIGVLDVDSPRTARFGIAEREFFEGLARRIESQLFARNAVLPRSIPAYGHSPQP